MIIATIVLVLVLIFGFVVFRGAPYVPSHPYEVKQAFESLYRLNKKSVLVDIGSGDGLVLRIAASFGAKAIGIELNPLLVLFSRLRSYKNPFISIHLADMWLIPLPDDTTVVYVFAVSRDLKKLAKKIQTEANRLDRPLDLITYGASLKDIPATKKHRGHCLYQFTPLQSTKA